MINKIRGRPANELTNFNGMKPKILGTPTPFSLFLSAKN